jgi:hypothetical protein
MKEFTTPSGKTLQIEEASFEDACDLNSLVIKELLDSGISLSAVIQEIIGILAADEKKKDLSKVEFSDLVGSPAVLEVVSRVFLSLVASPEVRKKALKCLERSLLNKERIVQSTFDLVENRKDYFFILKNCILTNVLCFI